MCYKMGFHFLRQVATRNKDNLRLTNVSAFISDYITVFEASHFKQYVFKTQKT